MGVDEASGGLGVRIPARPSERRCAPGTHRGAPETRRDASGAPLVDISQPCVQQYVCAYFLTLRMPLNRNHIFLDLRCTCLVNLLK